MNDVTIVMTTWINDDQRYQVAKDTLESWEKHLRYSGKIRLHISDDGSTYEWKLNSFFPTSYSRQERQGVGASLNTGFRKAFEHSPLVLYMVDDWQLTQAFDLDPFVYMLDNEDVGCVRLGPPHPYLKGTIYPLTDHWQGWGLMLNKQDYAVSHRPALYHKRFFERYGWWQEKVSALDCEKDMNVKYNSLSGPAVVLALPHPFYHIDQAELPSTSGVTP